MIFHLYDGNWQCGERKPGKPREIHTAIGRLLKDFPRTAGENASMSREIHGFYAI